MNTLSNSKQTNPKKHIKERIKYSFARSVEHKIKTQSKAMQ